MRVENVRQWQWILLSLVLGAGIGLVRQWMLADLEGHFGEAINSQSHFETALTRLVAGRPCFDDVHVYAAKVPDRKGGTKRAYIVAGDYFNGQFEQSAGKLKAEWRPAFFIADIPYQPKTNLDALNRPELVARFRSTSNPTVIDFLDLLAAARGTHFARSALVDLGIAGWMACSFVLIGLIWPVVVNLIVFGALRRPPEPKGTDLSKVKAVQAAPPPEPVEIDPALLAQLESSLASDPTPAPAEAALAVAAPIQPLSGSPGPRPITAAEREQAEFAAKQEDYYPTAKRTIRKHGT